MVGREEELGDIHRTVNDLIERNECAVRFGNRKLRAKANDKKNRKGVGKGEGAS